MIDYAPRAAGPSRNARRTLLTARTSETLVLDALAHRAAGYLDAKSLRAFLEKTVRVVDAGEAWVPRWMVAKVVDRLRACSEPHLRVSSAVSH